MYNLIIDLEMCNVPRNYRRRSYKYANDRTPSVDAKSFISSSFGVRTSLSY